VGTVVRGAWGRYSQSQPLFALQAQDGETAFAAADRAEQRVLGVEQSLPRGLTARAEAYDQRVLGRRPRWLNASAAIEVVPEIQWDRVLLVPDGGRSRGLELMLAREGGARADWTVSYALASAVDHAGGREIPRAVDQRHTLRGDWAFRPRSDRWRLAVAALWHTGRPYTPQRVTVDTLVNTPQQFSWYSEWAPGALHSGRLPAYHRVDARWTRYFDTRRGRVSVFAEVYNLFDTDNVRGYFTNVDVRGRTVSLVRTSDTNIPRLPAVGVAWEF
jgi:hypothetical protein